jgi:hypothetical protein
MIGNLLSAIWRAPKPGGGGDRASTIMSRFLLGLAGVILILLFAGTASAQLLGSTSAGGLPGRTTLVVVTMGSPSEYMFRISPRSVRRGTVIFKITNAGKLPHSFEIVGHTTKLLRPHQSTTLAVLFRKAARYFFSDKCVADPNAQEKGSTAPCAGGILRVT